MRKSASLVVSALMMAFATLAFVLAPAATAKDARKHGAIAFDPHCGTGWEVVPSPNPAGKNNALQAVSAVASDDVWAVGGSVVIPTQSPIIEHWDGTAWSLSDSSPLGASSLNGVAAIGPSDVWVVGLGPDGPLAAHWDGSSWSAVATPAVVSGWFNAVAAVGPDDVWAVGHQVEGGLQTGLIEHWDGTAWSVVPSPNPGTAANELRSVAAASATDVWAVGEADSDAYWRVLVEHWDGTAWQGSMVRHSDGMSAMAVAVGPAGPMIAGWDRKAQTVVLRFNGLGWTRLSTANPDPVENYLYGVAEDPAGSVWAVGRGSNSGAAVGIIERARRSGFVATNPGQPPSDFFDLSAVTVTPGGDVWAVGIKFDLGQLHSTLIEHLCH